jgi:hypothetical protein
VFSGLSIGLSAVLLVRVDSLEAELAAVDSKWERENG